ncbi:hypothetical protein OIU74_019508 [Salix koriyanagi]|uniref:Uncharacterized protein n=1 Tax=Salix koriyanagi TaxID=2511006 RepID=A0A9Q0P3S2_9ROSI|nr:hypothetical protein OIU74_019508 [Salix koriyanagi]
MGGGGEVSDKEEVQAPSAIIGVASTNNKRFKLPRKFLDDCDGVDHATVPRKLRSAMKKRNRESISPPFPDSKKPDHPNCGVEAPKRVGLKKSRLNVKQPSSDWSGNQSVCGPITKDEEEVVETLYSLAGMFAGNKEPKNGCKLDNTYLDACPSTLQEPTVKEDLNPISLPRIDEAAEKTFLDETSKVDCLNKPGTQERPYLPTDKIQGELGSCVAQVNLPTMLAKQEELKSLCNSINLFMAPEKYQDTPKVKHSTWLETSLASGLTTTVSQLDQQHTTCHSKNNGPALWPGLSPTISSGACNHGSSSQSSDTKFPSWMDTALGATRPNSFQNSIGKVSKVSTDKRSLKRSTKHVYISRLIQVLQIRESKDSLPLHLNQLKPPDKLRQGAFMTINDFNGNGNGLNGATSARAIMVDKNSNQVEIGTPPSGVHNSHKQTFNFLSLSTGGSGLEANNSSNGVGKRSEQSAQLQFPYPHPHFQQQHSTLVPYPMSQTYYSSPSYLDQPAAAQQVQIKQPSYLSNLYCGTRASPTGFTNLHQKQHQQQQQQNRLWASQLAAAQHRTVGNLTAMTQFPNWQNGRQGSPAQISRAQTVIPTSSSQEALAPKHAQISQQQLMTITTLPRARVRRQDHHLSSVYEETGGGFRTGGAQPLQLLCNESL